MGFCPIKANRVICPKMLYIFLQRGIKVKHKKGLKMGQSIYSHFNLVTNLGFLEKWNTDNLSTK